MSHAFYNSQWQSAMEELSEQIEIENPPTRLQENGKPAADVQITSSQAFQHFACLYLRYLTIYRKLEDCYDQILHPQKRQDLKYTLEVVMARICQVKVECMKFAPDGKGSDYLNLENYLLDLKLEPSHLEIPIPRYYREKHSAGDSTSSSSGGSDDANKKRDVLEKCLEEHGVHGGLDSQINEGMSYTQYIPKLTKEQAIRIIQKNERGRQGMVRAKLMKELRDEDTMRKKLAAATAGGGIGGVGGAAGSITHSSHPTNAATLIQKVFRGHLIRMKIAKQTQEEFIFLGMKSHALNTRPVSDTAAQTAGGQATGGVGGASSSSSSQQQNGQQQQQSSSTSQLSQPQNKGKYDPITKEALIRSQRKTRQIEHELTYIESLVELQKNVTELEGSQMKDEMWEERYEWWIQQKALTGKYPENFNAFYKERGENPSGGGPAVEEKPKKKKSKESEDEKKSLTTAEKLAAAKQALKDKTKSASGSAEGSSRENTKQGQKKAEEERKNKMALSMKTIVGPSYLINHMHECLTKYRTIWSQLDESNNFSQLHDEALAREKLRPLIKEKIKKEVDIRLLSYLDNIRAKVAQRTAAKKAASKKKKGKDGKGSKKKAGGSQSEKKGAASASIKKVGDSPDASTTKKKKKSSSSSSSSSSAIKKPKKCCEGEKSCAHMPLGDMISLLVKMGILQDLRKPVKKISDLIGDIHWLGSDYASAGINSDPSMQHLRSTLTETFILPLGSGYVKEQAPLCNTLLLYGPHGSGKTMLSKAIAAETNSCWFDLSPRNIEKKLGTKAEIAKLIHMVFKVATELQPSVIYIDEVDKIFHTNSGGSGGTSGGKGAASASSSSSNGGGGGGGKKNLPEVVKMKNFIMTHKAILTRANRCLVIGNSRQPYLSSVDRKDLLRFFGQQSFGKMIFCPVPNYATRMKLWKYFILQSGLNYNLLEKNQKFDLNTLAYISEGYSAGNIQQAVLATIPPRRVQKLLETGRPIDSSEFITALSKTSYTYANDYANYTRFTDAVTGETERRRLKDLEAAKAAEEKATEAKKKQPTKKKATA